MLGQVANPTTNPPAADLGPAAEPDDTLHAVEATARVTGGARPSYVHHDYLPKPRLTHEIFNNFLRNPSLRQWRYIMSGYTNKALISSGVAKVEIDPNPPDSEALYQVIMPFAILDISSEATHGFGLTAEVMTDRMAMESTLISKIFDQKYANQLARARVTNSAITAANKLLEAGYGTSLARPMYYLLSVHLCDGPLLPDMSKYMPEPQDYAEGVGGYVLHPESFQESWNPLSAFEIWSASDHSAATTETHIELTEAVLLDPVNAAVWVTAIVLRRKRMTAVHIYNVPSDPQWSQDFYEHLMGTHNDQAVCTRYMRSAGKVFHWAQELVAGSGSLTGALWLCALAHGHLRGLDNVEGYMYLNAVNSFVASERVYGPPMNPLVLWAYHHRYVELDKELEPLPFINQKEDTAKLLSVYFVAVLAGVENMIASQGFDFLFHLSPLPDPAPGIRDGDLRLHNDQLAAAKRDAMQRLVPRAGVKLIPVQGWKHRDDTLAIDLEAAHSVSMTTVPVWLVAMCSGISQPYDMGADIPVSRAAPPKMRSPAIGPAPKSVCTEVTNRKVFMTSGTNDRCKPSVYLYSDGTYVPLSVVQLMGILDDNLYDDEFYEEDVGTLSVVPTQYVFGQNVRVFAATPHDCMSNMVAPLTSVRVPISKVDEPLKEPLPLGPTAAGYDIFRL
jgi:hypothetical protein